MMISIWKADANAFPIETLPMMDYEEARVWFLESELVGDGVSDPVGKVFWTEVEMEEELIAISNGFVAHRSYELTEPDGQLVVYHIEGV